MANESVEISQELERAENVHFDGGGENDWNLGLKVHGILGSICQVKSVTKLEVESPSEVICSKKS